MAKRAFSDAAPALELPAAHYKSFLSVLTVLSENLRLSLPVIILRQHPLSVGLLKAARTTAIKLK